MASWLVVKIRDPTKDWVVIVSIQPLTFWELALQGFDPLAGFAQCPIQIGRPPRKTEKRVPPKRSNFPGCFLDIVAPPNPPFFPGGFPRSWTWCPWASSNSWWLRPWPWPCCCWTKWRRFSIDGSWPVIMKPFKWSQPWRCQGKDGESQMFMIDIFMVWWDISYFDIHMFDDDGPAPKKRRLMEFPRTVSIFVFGTPIDFWQNPVKP